MYVVTIGSRSLSVKTMADAVRLTVGIDVPFTVINTQGQSCIEQWKHSLRRLKQSWKRSHPMLSTHVLTASDITLYHYIKQGQ
jgi:hypothetical protein